MVCQSPDANVKGGLIESGSLFDFYCLYLSSVYAVPQVLHDLPSLLSPTALYSLMSDFTKKKKFKSVHGVPNSRNT